MYILNSDVDETIETWHEIKNAKYTISWKHATDQWSW